MKYVVPWIPCISEQSFRSHGGEAETPNIGALQSLLEALSSVVLTIEPLKTKDHRISSHHVAYVYVHSVRDVQVHVCHLNKPYEFIMWNSNDRQLTKSREGNETIFLEFHHFMFKWVLSETIYKFHVAITKQGFSNQIESMEIRENDCWKHSKDILSVRGRKKCRDAARICSLKSEELQKFIPSFNMTSELLIDRQFRTSKCEILQIALND